MGPSLRFQPLSFAVLLVDSRVAWNISGRRTSLSIFVDINPLKSPCAHGRTHIPVKATFLFLRAMTMTLKTDRKCHRERDRVVVGSRSCSGTNRCPHLLSLHGSLISSVVIRASPLASPLFVKASSTIIHSLLKLLRAVQSGDSQLLHNVSADVGKQLPTTMLYLP